jgi:hypothetical protein
MDSNENSFIDLQRLVVQGYELERILRKYDNF